MFDLVFHRNSKSGKCLKLLKPYKLLGNVLVERLLCLVLGTEPWASCMLSVLCTSVLSAAALRVLTQEISHLI